MKLLMDDFLGIRKNFFIAIGHLHIPAHGLNFINHMKLYINRPNKKKGRKKKIEKRGNKGPLRQSVD